MYDNEFFDNRLLFIGLDDFWKKRNSIKAIFLTKTTKDKYLYRMYVYSRPFISDTYKDYIWDYLQSYLTELEFANLHALYKRKHQRNN